ncbi:uncharacterized protein METZ01_LOCUS397441 [marine metagenome]|uniref:Uncharacterized protein n=1 Tax=marine metagenome TaxID=408172 RepID=A0A382VDP0_9ZZZZ
MKKFAGRAYCPFDVDPDVNIDIEFYHFVPFFLSQSRAYLLQHILQSYLSTKALFGSMWVRLVYTECIYQADCWSEEVIPWQTP